MGNQKSKYVYFAAANITFINGKMLPKLKKSFLNLSGKQILFIGQLSTEFLPDVHISQSETTDGVVDSKQGPER